MSGNLRYTLGREERLKSDVLITQLYEKGKGVNKYPLRITYMVLPEKTFTDSLLKVSINASKKGLRLAVKRNRMKRILREIYRHHKHPLIDIAESHGCCIALGVVYVGSYLMDYDQLERLFLKLQKRLKEELIAQLNVSGASNEQAQNGI